MANERYRDLDAALRAAVTLPSASELGLIEPPLDLSDHPTLSDFQRIGRGGMGVVFRAYDRALGRAVAVKLLPPGLHDAQARQRLVREGHALAALRHPHIVALHRIEEHRGRVLLVMELVSGVDVARWLKQQTRSFEAVRRVLAHAAEALVHAHAQGLIHRDFKPSNLMVREDDSGCVLDFGLTRRTSSEDIGTQEGFATLTAEGVVLGTKGYMAPELVRAERGDARSDQYGFGVAALETLQASGALQACPPALVSALERAKAAEPTQRHASMQDVLDALIQSDLRPRAER